MPRGLKRTDSDINLWSKELAPTTALRKWLNHEGHKFVKFRLSYLKELALRQDIVRKLLDQADNGAITLLFAADDHLHNHTIVLQDF